MTPQPPEPLDDDDLPDWWFGHPSSWFSAGPAYTCAKPTPPGPPITIDSLLEMASKIPKAPPPPSEKHCTNCKVERLPQHLHPIYTAAFPYSRPVAYLCVVCFFGLQKRTKDGGKRNG